MSTFHLLPDGFGIVGNSMQQLMRFPQDLYHEVVKHPKSYFPFMGAEACFISLPSNRALLVYEFYLKFYSKGLAPRELRSGTFEIEYCREGYVQSVLYHEDKNDPKCPLELCSRTLLPPPFNNLWTGQRHASRAL